MTDAPRLSPRNEADAACEAFEMECGPLTERERSIYRIAWMTGARMECKRTNDLWVGVGAAHV